MERSVNDWSLSEVRAGRVKLLGESGAFAPMAGTARQRLAPSSFGLGHSIDLKGLFSQDIGCEWYAAPSFQLRDRQETLDAIGQIPPGPQPPKHLKEDADACAWISFGKWTFEFKLGRSFESQLMAGALQTMSGARMLIGLELMTDSVVWALSAQEHLNSILAGAPFYLQLRDIELYSPQQS